MRAVIQRVGRADVRVDDKVVGSITKGLLVYVGVAGPDGTSDVNLLANKLRYLRIFPDNAGKMNLDVAQAGGAVLLVSNFTLCADTRQGRRPAFTGAAAPHRAQELLGELVARLKELGLTVDQGRFGEHMHIAAMADGPVNIVLDTLEAKEHTANSNPDEFGGK